MPTRRPPACTSPRSAARSRPGRTRWSCSTAPAGTAPATSPSPGTSPCCRSRPTRPSRTRSRTSGSTCARTSSAIASGRATTPSSRPAARRGTGSWRRPTGSPRSPAASGPERSLTKAVGITPLQDLAELAHHGPVALGDGEGALQRRRIDGDRRRVAERLLQRLARPRVDRLLERVAVGGLDDLEEAERVAHERHVVRVRVLRQEADQGRGGEPDLHRVEVVEHAAVLAVDAAVALVDHDQVEVA